MPHDFWQNGYNLRKLWSGPPGPALRQRNQLDLAAGKPARGPAADQGGPPHNLCRHNTSENYVAQARCLPQNQNWRSNQALEAYTCIFSATLRPSGEATTQAGNSSGSQSRRVAWPCMPIEMKST